ncbi:hypothetical protein BGZ98_005010, partial [Dissophora globulifera]
NWYYSILRALLRYLPKSVFTRSLQVMYHYRPQATFLAPVQDKGQIKPAPQPSLLRAQLARDNATVAAAAALSAAANHEAGLESTLNPPQRRDMDASSLYTTSSTVAGSAVTTVIHKEEVEGAIAV